ncbi:MAG: hypothetical protein F2667_02480 [Actinobacteria bacterium]|uniref:Unannotated protein n=1 Tax=freshwater metagenome TaxID=449393 RepID=A0A6J6NZM3_9ZZZZ|nr:hypothetical protein [Actinomycetota bacterium]
MEFSQAGRICSFCGRPGSSDNRLGSGLGAMICRECVTALHLAMTSDDSESVSRTPWETMADAELLETLPLILRSAEQNAAFATDWVSIIRERRISWAQIGDALGVSRQAVWERFAKGVEQRRSSGA